MMESVFLTLRSSTTPPRSSGHLFHACLFSDQVSKFLCRCRQQWKCVVCVCVWVGGWVCVWVFVYVYVSVCLGVWVFVFMSVYVCAWYMCVCCVCFYVCVCVYVCLCVHVCCVSVCVYVWVFALADMVDDWRSGCDVWVTCAGNRWECGLVCMCLQSMYSGVVFLFCLFIVVFLWGIFLLNVITCIRVHMLLTCKFVSAWQHQSKFCWAWWITLLTGEVSYLCANYCHMWLLYTRGLGLCWAVRVTSCKLVCWRCVLHLFDCWWHPALLVVQSRE